MRIKDKPVEERPREKLIVQGAMVLTDAELLAIFLRTGTRGYSAIELAEQLLQDFGSLQALMKADCMTFTQAKGLGNAKYAQLQAVLEMARRHSFEVLNRGDVLTSPEVTRAYLVDKLRAYEHEVFACLFLDNQHHILKFEELFSGTLDSASVYPREVVKKALAHNAAAVIFAHNHPSGINEASHADKAITQRLKKALELIDIRVLDHFIIADGRPFSFVEHGLI
jgi:DNA repair protein RadC